MNDKNAAGKNPLWMDPNCVSPQSPVNYRSVRVNRRSPDQRNHDAIICMGEDSSNARRAGETASRDSGMSPGMTTTDWEARNRMYRDQQIANAKGNKGGSTNLRENMGL